MSTNSDCIGFALYGVQASGEVRRMLYEELIAWFEGIGCPPDKISIHAPGFGGKTVGFSRSHSRLLKRDFSDLEALTVHSMLEGGVVPVSDWQAAAMLRFDYSPRFVFSAMNSTASFQDNHTKALMRSAISCLSPAYGIGFYRAHNAGPVFYAIGLNYGTAVAAEGEAYEEALAVSRWGDIGMEIEVFREGLIRDVYPYNYLSPAHLRREIGGVNLEKWIRESSARGSLTVIDEHITLWEVDEDGIGRIRNELWPTGVIFNWRNYLDQ